MAPLRHPDRLSPGSMENQTVYTLILAAVCLVLSPALYADDLTVCNHLRLVIRELSHERGMNRSRRRNRLSLDGFSEAAHCALDFWELRHATNYLRESTDCLASRRSSRGVCSTSDPNRWFNQLHGR